VHSFRKRIDASSASDRIGTFQALFPATLRVFYHCLRDLAEANVTTGALFCEWGSGYGVVACLAAMLDFDACGIEIEAELVEAARLLADDFEVPVQFLRGSFLPAGYEVRLEPGTGLFLADHRRRWYTRGTGAGAG